MSNKLPSGMWKRGESYYTRIRRTKDGKRTDQWRSLGSDRVIAERKHYALRASGRPGAAPVTVGEAAAAWLENYVATARNEKGRRDAAARVNKFLAPRLGSRRLDQLTGEHVRSYRLHLEQQAIAPGTVTPQTVIPKTIAPQTVVHLLSDLRCFLLWCVEAGHLDRSPFPRRAMPRIQERPPDRLTDEDADRLIQLPDPHGFAIRFALLTGLRWAEMCRAQRAHVEGNELVVARTKSGRVRRVPMPGSLLKEIRGRVGRLVPFAENNSGTFNRTVRRITDLETFHIHQCRHTFACRFLEKTRDLAALREILGHASIETTERYARLSAQHVRAAAERFAAEVGR